MNPFLSDKSNMHENMNKGLFNQFNVFSGKELQKWSNNESLFKICQRVGVCVLSCQRLAHIPLHKLYSMILALQAAFLVVVDQFTPMYLFTPTPKLIKDSYSYTIYY